MELLFKQLKQRFPLRYFYGENVPEGVSIGQKYYRTFTKYS